MNDNRYQFEKIKMCVGRQKRERERVQTLLFYGEKFSAREPTNKGIEVRIKPNNKKKVSLQVRDRGRGWGR